ncbi:hypothetical protein M9Y10_044023 [Tritrichomonas musculus]|uniref:Uncharacterized protein n=1 Tax=Tritrichomonas musculus TaxID=1915356 RepID=A0ABR2K4A4_9EUKA
MKNIKCLIIGDGAIGKTCLLVTFTKNEFPVEYIPTVYENYTGTIDVDGETVSLQLWDTAGQEDYRRIRPNFYPNTDVFLICFSLVSYDSLENVNSIWIPEIKNYCPDVPIVLVGLKSDLRDDPESHEEEFKEKGWEPIEEEKIEEVKNKIGAKYYVECSALKNYHIKEVFEAAARAIKHPNTSSQEQQQHRKICLLI